MLDDVADYPARLEIEYPTYQRRGVRLIGWWLAGIPQYLIAGIFVGSCGAIGWNASTRSWGSATWVGLIGVLVLCAVIVLLFRGEYPRGIFDFVLGLNRWVLRVTAYAAVMTPEYPPFRVDPGEDEPSGTLTAPPSGTGSADAQVARPQARWGPGRIAAVVIAGIGTLVSIATIAAGGTAIVLDQTQRDAAGYLMTSASPYSTNTYALVSASYRGGSSNDWVVARDFLGTVRVRVSSSRPVFVGIGREAAVNAYLANVAHAQGNSFNARNSDFRVHPGTAPATPPGAQRFWSASTSGAGQRTLTWTPRNGNWRIVLMNSDGSRAVNATVSIGARVPHLLPIGLAVLGGGCLLLLISGGGMYLAVRRRERRP
jgi:hypothetical protein